jgi:DNA-directed RNA polymerase specialized sigma24 family protein
MMTDQASESTGDGRFETTDWGLIKVAKGGDSSSARQALSDLCSSYWYPLYVYIRQRGYPADRAQDLTQGFFASLLGTNFLVTISPEKGRFRAYLLASLKHYLSNEHDRDEALKKGGGCVTISFNLLEAEGRYACEPWHEMTAERLFERRWALTLLGHVLDRLGGEMCLAGKGPLFARLRPALLGDGEMAPYRQVAEDLRMTEDAVKMAALRLRRRYRVLVRQEVTRTVGDSVRVDDEIRDLMAALSP